MPTHSSILAWRIPWTEEPGGLQQVNTQVKAEAVNARKTGHFFGGKQKAVKGRE